MISPYLNPIRFYDVTKLPNWSSRFPNDDNTTQRIEYVSGLNPSPYYKEFVQNQNLNLQFESETGDDTTLSVYKYSETTYTFLLDSTISPTDITPSGWDGNSILSYTKSFSEGTYQLRFADGYWSDVFAVISDDELLKRIVKIDYTHAENDYGCIFDNNFVFTNFFQGQFYQTSPENEIDAFEGDRGEEIKTQATPKYVYILNINDVHINYIKHINTLFSLDTIEVNGVEVENTEVIQVEHIDNSDLCNITIKLYEIINDYKYKR